MTFCLMGPTASGKTQLAIELVQRFPFEIISVDSAMVYRGLDIGTAKPNAEILKLAPHRLINIRDPKEVYSAGDFCHDVLHEIKVIINKGNIPLLVGGSMMYFRALLNGIASLPKANPQLRQEMQARANISGWEYLHMELMQVDPAAAKRIQTNDAQRIQRALEVFYLTGQTITALQQNETKPLFNFPVHQIALLPDDRKALHHRIAHRFDDMLTQGMVAEVEKLKLRHDLNTDLPSLRTVGYREVWSYLENEISYDVMREKSIIATRQLAKRQHTWLRTWQNVTRFSAEDVNILDKVCSWINQF